LGFGLGWNGGGSGFEKGKGAHGGEQNPSSEEFTGGIEDTTIGGKEVPQCEMLAY